MTTATATVLDNPLWVELEQLVTPGKYRWDPARQIDSFGLDTPRVDRFKYCSEYTWTITAPDTVAFVAEHLGQHVIDPMAGSGYWAYLLGQLGKDVVATDLAPPGDGSANEYHKAGSWLTVDQFDGVRSVGRLGVGRSLLLSWPPYDEPVGANILAAFTGDRLVYIGELDGGCCGDSDLFAALERDWDLVAEHAPVQWLGMHDYVHAYTRKPVALKPDLAESAYLITARHPASGRILAHARRSGLSVDDTWIGWAVQGNASWEIVDNITAARELVVELASAQLVVTA